MTILKHSSMCSRLLCFVTVWAAISGLHQDLFSAEPTVWIRHSGFADFSKGTFGDSGRNTYVSAAGRVQMIHRWDLNRDGFPDLVFTQDENSRSETPDAFVYRNDRGKFASLFPPLWQDHPRFSLLDGILRDEKQVQRLPTLGGGKSRLADLNRDGWLDLVFVNLIHNYSHKLNAYIYWGGPGFSQSRRTELPTSFAHGLDVADLNVDGYLDLVFANRGDYEWEPRFGPRDNRESYIYWGGATGFSPERRQSIRTHNALDIASGDFDGDGSADLAFINAPRDQSSSLSIYYGQAGKFPLEKRVTLTQEGAIGLRTLELNGDKAAELFLALEGQYSLVLPGGRREEPSLEDAIRLPVAGAQDAAAADLNGDGVVDLVVASTETTSIVFWGSPAGFSRDQSTSLPTLRAVGLALEDFDADGATDIVFANHQDDQGHDVPSYIYWGSPEGYAPYLRSEIQGFGPLSVAAGDVDNDGRPDIALLNHLSGKYPDPLTAQIFWGNRHGHYSAASMTGLRNVGDGQVTNADLNDDGYPDLVFMSVICWGGPEGFDEKRRTQLATGRTLLGSRTADLNRDGYLDLLCSKRRPGQDDSGVIYWGSSEGFDAERRKEFPLPEATVHPTLADLDRDGFLDMINASISGRSSILWGSASGFGEREPLFLKTDASVTSRVADLDADGWLDLIFSGSFSLEQKSKRAESYIYYGSEQGFLAGPPVRLLGYSNIETGIGDLNRDGSLDLVFGNYSNGMNRSLPIFLYWGGGNGTFQEKRRTDLPAESSCGIQVLDLNRDGYLEIVVHNHIVNGRHDFGAYIYWGGSQGYSIDRRTQLPTTATHMSTILEPGNVYTRRLEEEYISPPISKPPSKQVILHWEATTPLDTGVQFQMRAAGTQEALAATEWRGPSGPKSYFTSSGASLPIEPESTGWIQYRAVLTTPDGGNSPVLRGVSLECQGVERSSGKDSR